MKQFLKAVVTGRKRLYLVGAAFLVVVLVNLVFVNRAYSFFEFDDELGYWSNAGQLVGYDWSGLTEHMNWYSYGYSLVLYVLIRAARLLGGNMTTAYRLALCANAAMCGGIFLLCYRMIRRLTGKDEWISLAGGMASALTMMLLFHSRIGWTECILALLTTAIAAIALYDPRRERMPLNVLLSALVGYTYVVHNRMAGLVLAFAVYAVAAVVAGDKRLQKAVALGLPLAVILVVNIYLSRFFKVRMWGVEESPTNPHTVSMMVGKLREVFSAQGMLAVVRETIGQLWYLGLSTFGLFYLGLVHVVAGLKECVAQKRVGQGLAWGLVLLGFVLSLGVSVIYWYNVYMPENRPVRGDVYYYGRYIENWASVYVALGCCRLSRVFERRPSRLALGLFAALHLLATVSILSAPYGGMKSVNTVCVSGMAALSKLVSDRISIWTALAVSLIVVGLFAAVVLLGRRYRRLRAMICLPLCVATLVSTVSSSRYVQSFIGSFQESIYALSQVVESEMRIPDTEPAVLVGFPDSNSPVNKIGAMMKRLQFLKPRARCSNKNLGKLEDYLDGRADWLMLNMQPGMEYASGMLKQYRGVYIKLANAIAFDLTEKVEAQGVEIPLVSVDYINGAAERDGIRSNENVDFTLYSPFIALPAGKYSATIEGRLIEGGFSEESYLKVTVGSRKRQIAILDNLGDCVAEDTFRCTCPFELEKYNKNCRLKMYVDPKARVCVSRITLRRLEDDA